MNTQRSLDLDVFQLNEVREIFAIVKYSYTDEYESSPACEFGTFPATYTSYTTSAERELSLGVTSSELIFSDIKPNLDAIENYVKQFMIENYSKLQDFTILEVNIKYRVRDNFDLTKYASASLQED